MSVQPRPWMSGIRELLDHATGHLAKETDADRRIALISIDNSVEIMIKTYLGLPERVTGFFIPIKERNELFGSFHRLIGALEKHARDRLDGIDLSDLEWFHNLRNEIYHLGNGITVDQGHVAGYATLAEALYKNLCGVDPKLRPENETLQNFFEILDNVQAPAIHLQIPAE